ncbi:hypothetical protein KJ695_03355 [Patescibacteria group bacterium]|nr:hypothetical protein [Patescibacteria group bacterium]MBU4056917.1 hypothetical protein [Patescibacteria group bacterium]MBU4368443.1 hypothetical protein [Patescibacteria group bacterium]
MREKIGKLDIKDIEKNLIEGVGILSHDLFLSIVRVVKVKSDSEKSFTVTVPHYINDISGINNNEGFKKAVKDSPARKITLILKNNEIEYKNGNLCSKIPFTSPPEEVLALLENLKLVNYKDSGFVTALIDKDGFYIQGPCVLMGSFGT